MLSGGGDELAGAGVDVSRIRARARDELPSLRERALAVFARWAAVA
jgi:hypothetical protein